MNWIAIRKHFEELMIERQLTQQQVAAAGKIGQSAVSTLLTNTKRGPCVDTFVKAVHGLGMSVATFFATLDAAMPSWSVGGRASVGEGGSYGATDAEHSGVVISTHIKQGPVLDYAQLEGLIEKIYRDVERRLQERLGRNHQHLSSAEAARTSATPNRRRRARGTEKIA
jgi:hypothetical protein